jgi:anti-anti-sigma factor
MIDVSETIVLEINITEPSVTLTNANNMLPLLKKAAMASNKDIEINFTAVESIDSSGINMLVKFQQHLMGTKRTITLTHIQPDIMKIFEMVKLSNFFKIAKNTKP